MARPSRVLKSLLPDTSDETLEKFASLYKMQTMICSECLDTSEVIIVKGEDIRKYYDVNKYQETEDENEGESPIFQSCMRYESCQDYFDIYTKNSIVSMAIFRDKKDKISSRCLLWTWGELTYYDRIYATTSKINTHMQACLEKLGFINISGKNPIKPNQNYDLEFTLAYGERDLDYFPYMDTMEYLSGRVISNVGGDVILNDTEGGHSGKESLEICDMCNEETEDLHYIGTGSHQSEHMCDECCGYSEYHREYIADRDGVETDYDGFILKSEVIRLWDDETCRQENAVKLWNGTYMHNSESERTSVEGHKFMDEEDFILVDGEYYSQDSDLIEEVEGEYKLVEYV